ncbi:MAG: LysM peptidoglycan-binding domain-containing protein [Puniceicoccales bacterium]|nr:LysM peptidoglycan-binding domain-containing protein [Puniceicoccales bacterium]
MLKSIFFSIFIGCTIALAKPASKITQDFAKTSNEQHATLQKKVTDLEIRLQNTEIKTRDLTNQVKLLADRQAEQNTNTTKESLQKDAQTNITEIVDQRIKFFVETVSQELNNSFKKLSSEFDTLLKKVDDALTAITSMNNAQQQLSALISPKTNQSGTIYEVKVNDTVDKIAEKFKRNPTQIEGANLLNGDRLVPGQMILIPE